MAELRNLPGTKAAMEFLVVDRSDGTRCFDAAEGTREQLVAAGLCTLACFPSGRRRSAHCDEWNWTLDALGQGRWRLVLQLTDEQRRERRRVAALRYRAQQLADRIAAGPERWRDEALAYVETATGLIAERLAGETVRGGAGFTLSARDLASLSALTARMRLLVANASIERDETQAGEGPEPEAQAAAPARPTLRLVRQSVGGQAVAPTIPAALTPAPDDATIRR